MIAENRNWIPSHIAVNYIGKNTLKVGIRRYNNGDISSYRNQKFNGITYISYEDLPDSQQRKIPLAKLQQSLTDQDTNKQVAAYQRIIEGLIREYQRFYNDIKSRYPFTPECCTELAQIWAVWDYITNKCDRGNTNFKHFHAAYIKVFPSHLTNYKSFSRYKNDCVKNGIEATVIDRRLVGTSQRRLSDAQYLFIRTMYMDDRKFSSPQIHRKLRSYCESIGETDCSKETVKYYMREVFEKDAECYAARYGENAAKRQNPYATLLGAEYIHDQWQGDGWDVPLFVRSNNKIIRLKVFPFIDNHSRKIIGYSVGKSENTVLIMEALNDAIRNTGVLPGEFVFDKHSYHKTDIAKRFRAETERMGIVWTVSTNPQRKAIVERYFQYLDGVIKENHTGYIGQGITAKNKDARRNPETYTELRKTENLLTEHEAIAIIADTIHSYNNTALTVLGDISPNEAYARSKAKHAINVTESERVSLIAPVLSYKVDRMQITIRVGIIKHEFQLPAHLHYLNNERVNVHYEDLNEGIYIVDIDSGETHAIAPKPKIHGAIVNQTDRDVELLNQLKGRRTGIAKKSSGGSKAIADRILVNSPEIIDYIAPYTVSKDVHKSLQENRELQLRVMDLGVTANKLPVRTISQKIPTSPAKAKDIESPFNPTNHTPGMFDIHSFINGDSSH